MWSQYLDKQHEWVKARSMIVLGFKSSTSSLTRRGGGELLVQEDLRQLINCYQLIGFLNACYLSSWFFFSSSSLTLQTLTTRALPRDPNHLDSLIRHHGSGCREH